MLRVKWNVTQGDLVWISHHELVTAVGVWWDRSHNLGVGVLELSVSTEVLSLF